MTQTDFGTIDPATKSGTALATDLNAWRDTIHSQHKGGSRPSYATAGIIWINDTTIPWVLNLYDGAEDIPIGTFNPTTNIFSVPSNSTELITTTGSANVYAATVSSTPAAYAAGMFVRIAPNFVNTGSCTINVNTLGAKTAKDLEGNALVGGELLTTGIYDLVYNGTDFILVNFTRKNVAVSANGVLAPHKNLVITDATVATVDIDADEIVLSLTTDKTKQFLATVVNLTLTITASGALGLDTGTEAGNGPSTWYHLYVLAKADGTLTGVFSLVSNDITSITLPSGYIYAGYVGAIYNDSGSNLLSMRQENIEATLDIIIKDVDDNAPGTSANLGTLTTPPNMVVKVNSRMSNTTAISYTLFTETTQTDTAASVSAFALNTTSTGSRDAGQFEMRADGSSQIRYRTDNTNTDIIILTVGWILR